MNAFLTGTDTGVGKTHVAARLIRENRANGIPTVPFKPLCCGPRDDAEMLRAAAGDSLSINEVNPVWLRTPAAPYVASLVENRPLDLALVHETYRSLRARHESILIEGAGGWLVPITADYTFADLAADFGLPIVVVVKNRLGALNHAALTVAHIRSRGLVCAGLILNHGPISPETDHDPQQIARATNRAVLEELLAVRVIREFPLVAAE